MATLAASMVAASSAMLSEPASRSWWLAQLPSSVLPPITATPPATADVVIIGAGLTGCATAYWLQKLFGRSSVVLDARGVAGGATGRNGGHLWPNPTSAFEQENVAELVAFLEEEGVECDMTQHGAVALDRQTPEEDVEYHDCDSGDPEVSAEDGEDWGEVRHWDGETCATQLQTDAFSSGAHYPEARQLYPAKVACSLLRASGATLCAPVRVLEVEAAGSGAGGSGAGGSASGSASGGADGGSGGGAGVDVGSAAGGAPGETSPRGQIVTTDRGVVRAGKVVVCTNGWAGALLPELKAHLYPVRNQVLMSAPTAASAAWGVGALSVDSEIGARELYMIRRPDGRLCLGGARALEPGAAVGSTDDGSLSEPVGRYLRRFLREHFPRLGPIEVEAEWTGILGFTADQRPLIGQVRPEVYAGVGFCGQGMPQCTGAGKALAAMVAGHDERVHPFVRGAANVARVLDK